VVVVRWQVSQAALVTTWLADLPSPVPVEVTWAPSWQTAQAVANATAWFIDAGFHEVLLELWQLSQLEEVGT
jgi:hypothetical protein